MASAPSDCGATARSPCHIGLAVALACAATVPVTVPMFQVTVPYGEINPDRRIKQLPLMIRLSEQELSKIEIVSVNGKEIFPIQVPLVGDDGEHRYRAEVDFNALSKHFESGMNRFEVQMGAETAEVLLEIEF